MALFGFLANLFLGCVGAAVDTSPIGDDGSMCDATSCLQVHSKPYSQPPALHEMSWFCYRYAFGQDDNWCAETPSIGALELQYTDAAAVGACGGMCKCCARAARMDKTIDDPWPRPVGKSMDFVTCESRQEDVELWLIPGVKPKNVCYGAHWEGFATKTLAYQKHLADIAASDPKRMVVVLDSDIGWGGCSEEELLSRYRAIVEASDGASIVAGADPILWPPGRLQNDEYVKVFEKVFVQRFEAVFGKFGLDPRAWEAFVPEVTSPFTSRHPDGPRWLNSGFFMGPAIEILWLLNCTIQEGVNTGHSKRTGGFQDQLGAGVCAALHPEKVALDYTSLLVAQTNFPRNNLVQIEGRRILNNLAGMTQCFVHADGRGSSSLKDWLRPATAVLALPH